MTSEPLKTIAIYGSGLAAHLCALSLVKHLPEAIEVTLVANGADPASDMFYGTLAPPSTYDFFLSIGITEPELLLSTRSHFSLGTEFANWGAENSTWKQVFHRPLPIHNGVQFHHYLNYMTPKNETLALSPFIMSAVAADKSVFAHPPEGKNIPLAALEYGYHLDPEDLVPFLTSKIAATRVHVIDEGYEIRVAGDSQNASLISKNGAHIDADLIIDCRSDRTAIVNDSDQAIAGCVSRKSAPPSSGLCRSVTETNRGFEAETEFRSYIHELEVVDITEAGQLGDETQTICLGRIDTPWEQNVLHLGLSAGAVAPLTDAPLRLLQLDILRLIELIPTSKDMRVEAREYNRRFISDFDLAEMFQRALFSGDGTEGSTFRRQTEAQPVGDSLQRKLTQFTNRGVLVNYDNEPYQDHDWISLHIGMGRRPKRFDPLTVRVSDAHIEQMLSNIRLSIAQMSAKMPPYQTYMTRFLAFLKDKHG
jgi:tryptophan halogenase